MKDMTVETLSHPRSAITDTSHVDSSKKDTVGKESKKHES